MSTRVGAQQHHELPFPSTDLFTQLWRENTIGGRADEAIAVDSQSYFVSRQSREELTQRTVHAALPRRWTFANSMFVLQWFGYAVGNSISAYSINNNVPR